MSASPLSISIKGPSGPLPVGLPIAVEIVVKNVSDKPVWMVGVVDGSEEGVRYPNYLPAIMLDGKRVAGPQRPEDNLVGPLRLHDFVLLQPGESFDPTARQAGRAYMPFSTFANFRPDRPGRYAFTLTLSTESKTPDQWLGRFAQDESRAAIIDRLALVPKLTVASNTFEIDIK